MKPRPVNYRLDRPRSDRPVTAWSSGVLHGQLVEWDDAERVAIVQLDPDDEESRIEIANVMPGTYSPGATVAIQRSADGRPTTLLPPTDVGVEVFQIGPPPDHAGTPLGQRLQGIESQQAAAGQHVSQLQLDLQQATQDLAHAREDLLAKLATAQAAITDAEQAAETAQGMAANAAQESNQARAAAQTATGTAQQAVSAANRASSVATQASTQATEAKQTAAAARDTADTALDEATNGTVPTGRIVPGGHLLTGARHLAPGSITLRELLVTEQLAAALGNFLKVTTQMLVAGSARITADLLADEIRLATRLIAGDPAGTHAVLDSSGLRVKRALPTGGTSEVVRLGVSGSSDHLGVVDAHGNLLAAIDDRGRVTSQALAVAGSASVESLEVGGTDILDVIDSRVTCQIARISKSGNHWYVAGQPKAAGARLAIFEFSVVNPFDHTLNLLILPPVLTVYVHRAGRVDVSWWATNNGATPAAADDFRGASATAWGSGDVAVPLPPLPTGLEPGRTLRVRCVVSATAPWDLSRNQVVTSAMYSLGTPSVPHGATGTVLNVAAGSVAPAKRRHVKEYSGTWGASFALNGAPAPAMDPKAVQGHYPGAPQRMGMVGFQPMTSDLSGADIEKVELYLYTPHWYYSSGGSAGVGFHGHLAKPGWWSGTHASLVREGIPKPGGVWVTLPSWTHDHWKTGSYRGITLRAPGDSTDPKYYGYADYTRCRLRVTYLK